MPSITKTAMSIAPSSQSDSPSIVMFLAMKMEMISATSSSRVEEQVHRRGQEKADQYQGG